MRMQDTYDRVEQIGAGGGGAIYRAHHKRLDKIVVLKKIHEKQLSTIESRAELNILKDLKHPYIPQIFDFLAYEKEVYTVMEYIPGESFAQLLQKGTRFRQKDVVKWTRQLCEVVAYLHSRPQPIIHCDIKPANVMLTPQGDICLIDFNISGVKTEEKLSTIGYTNCYAPAEQFAVVAARLEQRRSNVQRDEAGNAAVQAAVISELTEVSEEDDDLTQVGKLTPEEELTQVGDPDATEVSQVFTDRNVPTAHTSVSLLKSLSDEEWQRAKDTAAALEKRSKAFSVDERTDIYSIGAVAYHILTGKKPAPFWEKQIPVLQLCPNVGEGLAFLIENAMQTDPADRFQQSSKMLKMAENLGKVDKRYRTLSLHQTVLTFFMGLMVIVSGLVCFGGYERMQEERRTEYAAYINGLAQTCYEMSLGHYEQKAYAECLEYLEKEVFGNGSLTEKEPLYDRFYYIAASCHFALEDYPNACIRYAEAVVLNPEETTYYRDYVIALARQNRLDEAEKILQQASAHGVQADTLSLLRGEIYLMRGEYEKAEQEFAACIENAEDAYLKLRAYTKLDDTYQLIQQGGAQYEQRMESLEEALDALPSEYRVTLTERLAQVYIDYSDVSGELQYCEKAIGLFEKMESSGYGTFLSRLNIAILYEKLGEFAKSKQQLHKVLEKYPDNYQVYKRLAFTELEIQSVTPKAERAYEEFGIYYEQAQMLYEEFAKQEDMEMLSLGQLYQDVVANGWL